MELDDSARRQLRFSMVLQIAAFAMLFGAFVIRILALGWDLVSMFLLLGSVIVAAALTWTVRTLRSSTPTTGGS